MLNPLYVPEDRKLTTTLTTQLLQSSSLEDLGSWSLQLQATVLGSMLGAGREALDINPPEPEV
jgi:hypothetical protein